MGTNGVILINLENRNAAEFESILVPGSYEKALGAATAGTYVTVYKWLYNGFAMTASLCTAENKTEYISLVDKTNGGELKVYDDDTITLVGAVAPEPPEPPTPVMKNFKAYHITSGSTTSPYSLMLQKGHFVGTEFSTEWDPADMILDGDPIEITQSMCSGTNTPYLLEGCATIAYVNGWIVRAPEFAHEWMVNSYWVYYWPNTLLHQWENTASGINKYFCEDGGSAIPDVHLVPLEVTENGTYLPEEGVDGFNSVEVNVSAATVNLHYGKMDVRNGTVTENSDYCYSDLIPITTGNGTWFIDLSRDTFSTYYIGVILYDSSENIITYFRQTTGYRVYSETGSQNARFLRLTFKVSDSSFANTSLLQENFHVVSHNSIIKVMKGEIS